MIFLLRRILALFLAVNKKLSMSIVRANTARFASVYRLLRMPFRCQANRLKWVGSLLSTGQKPFQKCRGDVALLEVGVVEDAAVEWDGGLDAFDDEFV